MITINATKGGNIYFTLIDSNGDEYKWHKGVESLATEDDILLLIRRREYPDAPAGITLTEFDEWIAAGCIIRQDDEGNDIIAEKVPFASTHPAQRTIADVIADTTVADDLAAASTVTEIKAVLVKMMASPAA